MMLLFDLLHHDRTRVSRCASVHEWLRMREHARGFCDAVTGQDSGQALPALSSVSFPSLSPPPQSVHSILASSRHGQCPPIRRRLSTFSVISSFVLRADPCTHMLFHPNGFIHSGIKEDKK